MKSLNSSSGMTAVVSGDSTASYISRFIINDNLKINTIMGLFVDSVSILFKLQAPFSSILILILDLE
jgi:hypothetical protein